MLYTFDIVLFCPVCISRGNKNVEASSNFFIEMYLTKSDLKKNLNFNSYYIFLT